MGLLQFTMDLFEGLGSEFAPPAPAPARPRRVKKPKLVAPPPAMPLVPSAPPVPPDPHAPPAVPAVSLAETLALASFVHPQASREVVLGSARVAYEFKRGKRKTIGFLVGAEGLSVRAPRWVALRDVDAAIREKADWILRKLTETQQRHARVEATRIDWRDGAVFPFMGESVVIRLDPKHGFASVGGTLDAASEEGGPRVLRLAVAQNAEPSQIRDAAQAWLMRQARKLFIERLDHFAPAVGRAVGEAVAVECDHAVGKRERGWVDSAELAADSFQAACDRLRGRARTGAPAGDGPLASVLGDGGERGAGL
jgi:predicted metal-dependent hydrolase